MLGSTGADILQMTIDLGAFLLTRINFSPHMDK